jgi:hypothetical protein
MIMNFKKPAFCQLGSCRMEFANGELVISYGHGLGVVHARCSTRYICHLLSGKTPDEVDEITDGKGFLEGRAVIVKYVE